MREEIKGCTRDKNSSRWFSQQQNTQPHLTTNPRNKYINTITSFFFHYCCSFFYLYFTAATSASCVLHVCFMCASCVRSNKTTEEQQTKKEFWFNMKQHNNNNNNKILQSKAKWELSLKKNTELQKRNCIQNITWSNNREICY